MISKMAAALSLELIVRDTDNEYEQRVKTWWISCRDAQTLTAQNPVDSPFCKFPQRLQDKQLSSAKVCSGQPWGQAHWPILLPSLSQLSFPCLEFPLDLGCGVPYHPLVRRGWSVLWKQPALRSLCLKTTEFPFFLLMHVVCFAGGGGSTLQQCSLCLSTCLSGISLAAMAESKEKSNWALHYYQMPHLSSQSLSPTQPQSQEEQSGWEPERKGL